MGSGKTVLIGAIVATEFAMAIEYPGAADEDHPFIENALVFAPGTTILEALRELSRVPFDRILPPRLYERFGPSLTVTYTRDGERDIPVTRGSRFNLVVTNTEMIGIQARPVRRARAGAPLARLFDRSDEEAREVANLRLQAIASLPHLGSAARSVRGTRRPLASLLYRDRPPLTRRPMRSVRQTAAVDAIELDLDAADDELVRAFATIVRELALERRDMADPLTAIEADRRLGEQVPGGSVEYLPSQLFAPPVWSVYRNEVPDAAMSLANAGAPAS